MRITNDGSDGDVVRTLNGPKFVFGSSLLHDHHVKDIQASLNISCEISTDDLGRVSVCFNLPMFVSSTFSDRYDMLTKCLISN